MNKRLYWLGQVICAAPALVIGLMFSAQLVSTGGWLMVARFWGALFGFMAFIIIPVYVGSALIQRSKQLGE